LRTSECVTQGTSRVPNHARAASKSYGDYIYGVDVVRFACSVGVGIYHLATRMPEFMWPSTFGWIGVEIFFVISGLVIANSAHRATPSQFAVSRFLRLYPTAWCAALVNYPLFLLSNHGEVRKILPLIFSLLILPGPFLATAYWTLPVEISFYCLILLAIILLGFEFHHIQWIAVLLILWSAPYLLLLGVSILNPAHFHWVEFGFGPWNTSLLRHGPFFALGMLIWLYKENKITALGIFAATWALLLGLLEICCRAIESIKHIPTVIKQPEWLSSYTVLSSECAFCLGVLAILCAVKFNRQFPRSYPLRRFVRILGLTTYPFYLIHQRVGGYVSHELSERGTPDLVCLVSGLVATGVVSFLIAMYMEPAFRGLLTRHFRALNVRGRAQATTPVTSA